MKIRGERECTECATRWSYFETGSIGCPACGSLRSVGTDERAEHTDRTVSFDLTSVRADIDDVGTGELATRARETCREYVRQRGFIRGGTLLELDDTYLAANELAHVADIVSRRLRLTTAEELYFLELLRDADSGTRPPVEDAPSSLREARGSAYADAVHEYRTDIRTWTSDRTLDSDTRACLDLLGEHETRIRLLEGDVEPTTAETLLEATRDLADALRGDEVALLRARQGLEQLF